MKANPTDLNPETFSSKPKELPAAAEDRQVDGIDTEGLWRQRAELDTAAEAQIAAEAELGADAADPAASPKKGVAAAESIIENVPSASNSIAALTKLNQSLSEELKAKDTAHTAELEKLSLARLKENQSMHSQLRKKDTAHAAHMAELAETTSSKADGNQPEVQAQSTAPVKNPRLEMRVRVASARQFANEVKWELLAHQLRNEHLLTCFDLEKWMNSGLR